MKPARLLSFATLGLALTQFPASANAQTALRADLIETKSLKLDGVPKEWTGLVALSSSVKNKASKPDLEAKGGVVYDNTSLYVGADVTDDVFKPGLDHIVFVIGFPGGASTEVELWPGDPGKTAGSAKIGGKAVTGAKVVEAPKSGGWSIEASIPWSAFTQASSVRVGLRAGLFVHDADGAAVETIMGTATSTAYASLPQVATETEQSLADGLLKEKGIKGAPKYNLLGDVAADAMKERVLVYERYLVVLGSHFRKGSEYYFLDMGADASTGMVPFCELKDITGDGQQEIVLRKRVGSSTKYREIAQVMSFGKADVPNVIFTHETAVVTEAGSVESTMSFAADGSKQTIKFEVGTAKSFNAGNYKEPTESSYDPVLLPWGTVKSQTYKYDGSKVTKSAEEKQDATPAPAPAATPTTQATTTATPKSAPPPPNADALLDKVYATYKKDRSVTAKAKFDLTADVAGDKTTERVLLHDKDIVLFGKAFRSGTAYSYITLQQFADAKDITEVSVKDVTGDGKAEVIVKGIVHAAAPKESGGGTVDREVLLVFQVQGESLKRVFAAEIGRAIGSNKVTAGLELKSGSIVLGPGKFVGWTEKTYPFNQDVTAVGGFEPLILPLASSKSVAYKWSANAFTKP